MPFNTDPFGPYLLAGAQAGEQARLHKADLAALMQRFQQQQDFAQREFEFKQTAYGNEQQQAAQARAQAAVEQGISNAPLETSLAEPTHDWRVPEVIPGYDRPMLQMGKQGPTGIGTEYVPRYRMPGQEAEGLVKSAVAAHYGGATNAQEAQAIIESKLRQQREKGYAGLRQGYTKMLADPDWLKARASLKASGTQEKETAYKAWSDSLTHFQRIVNDESNERADYVKSGAADLPEDRKVYWDKLKKDATLRLGQLGKEMTRLMGINAGYEEPVTVPPPTPAPAVNESLLNPPSLPTRFGNTAVGGTLSEAGAAIFDQFPPLPFQPGPVEDMNAARAAQKQLYPTLPEPPIFHQGKTPPPYKSSGAAQPKGIRVPAPQGPTPIDSLPQAPTGRLGPQSALPMQMGQPQGGITAGAPDLQQMVAMLDKAMPWMSDKDMAELVRRNMNA